MKALEIENIEELMEKESPYLVAVGLKIAEAARLGAPLVNIKKKGPPRGWRY